MSIPEPCLQATDLEYARDDRILFRSLNFDIKPGEALLIEGHNGSGKTTLLRILCGLILPDAGQIKWSGDDIQKNRHDFAQAIAYVGHHDGLKGECTPLENLELARALHDSGNDYDSKQALAELGLYGFDHQLCRTLSAGQRRRVALARIRISPAKLWILDEPLTAIDKTGIADLEALITRHLQAGGMAVLTSHHALNLPQVNSKSLVLGQ